MGSTTESYLFSRAELTIKILGQATIIQRKYVLTISNKGWPYPFVYPLRLLLGPASLGLLSTSGSRSTGLCFFVFIVNSLQQGLE